MRKYLLYLVLPFCWACSNFIDVEPENSVTYTNFFKSKKDAEALLTELQVHMTTVFLSQWTEAAGDMAEVNEHFLPTDLTSWGMVFDWAPFFRLIYQADLILDNAHRFESLTKEELEHIAYALKAVAHPNRLAIICLLSRNEELNVSEICEQMACSQALISHHLTDMYASRRFTGKLRSEEK